MEMVTFMGVCTCVHALQEPTNSTSIYVLNSFIQTFKYWNIYRVKLSSFYLAEYWWNAEKSLHKIVGNDVNVNKVNLAKTVFPSAQ